MKTDRGSVYAVRTSRATPESSVMVQALPPIRSNMGAAADRLKCQAVVVLGISLGYALSLTVVLTPIASRISCSRPTPTVW